MQLFYLQLFCLQLFEERCCLAFKTGRSQGLEDAEAMMGMPFGVVLFAQLFLDEAAALKLLCAGETGPVDGC